LAVGRDGTTRATTFKAQLAPQLLGALVGFVSRWPGEQPHRLTKTDHLRMGPQRQIQNGAAAMAKTTD
jgi:hypothetical protein